MGFCLRESSESEIEHAVEFLTALLIVEGLDWLVALEGDLSEGGFLFHSNSVSSLIISQQEEHSNEQNTSSSPYLDGLASVQVETASASADIAVQA